MTGLTSEELTSIRAMADDFFPDTCTIQTQSSTVDGLDAPDQTSFANTYTNVPCRADPANPRDEFIQTFVKEGAEVLLMSVPYDQAVSTTDRVVYNSLTWNVLNLLETNIGYQTVTRFHISRLT